MPTDAPDHVELVAGGAMIALSTTEAARRHHHVEPAPGSPAGCLVLWVHDLDHAHEVATRAGAAEVNSPHASGNSNVSTLLRDPDGNLVEFVAKA